MKNKISKVSTKLSDEMKDYIIKVAPTTTNDDLTKKFNKKFGTNYASGTIQNQKHYLGAKSLNSKFKKNQKCHNLRPVGSEMISRGKTYIKVNYKVGKRSWNHWEPKQRYMYKKYHGSIPKNHAIIFLNCNKNDYSKDNLIAVDMNITRIMVRLGLLSDKPCEKELTMTGIMIAQLYVEIGKLKDK